MLLVVLLLATSANSSSQEFKSTSPSNPPQSDVFLQGFYWNSTPGGIWYDSLARLAPRFATAGFGAVWFPSPAKGAAGGLSMGYDPYDHFDFGEYNQKGSIETRFGSREELIGVINTYHSLGMQVFADAVMSHMNGGESKIPYECKPYPSYADSAYLLFNYPFGSGRFKKDASYFYPNLQTCNVNPPYHGPDDPVFKFGENLAHDKTKVKDSLIVWGQYLRNVLGFDGFRIDAVKHIDPIFVGSWLQQSNPGGYAVAEYYGSASEIGTWLHYCQNVFGGDVSMFDFPLRFALKDMCDNTSGGYDMNWLDGAGLLNAGISGFDVATFVDNHDLDRVGWDGFVDNGHSPIVNDKEMAYAYTIFSEGRPCVWYRDYFVYGLDRKIDTLIWIRQNILYGGTTKRGSLNPFYVGAAISQEDQSKDIYVARRDGGNGHPAAYLVLNDHPTEWRGVWVDTQYPDQVFRDYTGVAIDKQAAVDGRVDLWAPPRGYAIYVPDTSLELNHAPFIQTIPDREAFTNTPFSFQLSFGDPNGDSVLLSISGNPSWLTLSANGLVSGTPGLADTGTSIVIISAMDGNGAASADTFHLTVLAHPVMDGLFEGSGVWNLSIALADTLQGWDTVSVRNVYVTSDEYYFYFGASVTAREWMNWVFLVNTKPGGGSSDSWLRSVVYDHANKPDYILRGYFTGYAELHTWTGSVWSGVGTALSTSSFGDNITSNSPQAGWVEVRIPRASIGNPAVMGVQCYITGNQNSQASFDACPNDQNTPTWSGFTTHLKYYAYSAPKAITQCNIQFPSTAALTNIGSTTIYARAFGVGVTDSAGIGVGVQSWIGYSTTNTNPSTWTNWVSATYNVDANQHDEYRAVLGYPLLSPGTYYYASRFQFNGGPFVYGGYSAGGSGFWNGTTNVSGILRIYTQPTQTTLLSPPDNAADLASTTLLSWNPVVDAQTYRLQVAYDSLFNALILDDSTLISASRQIGPIAFGDTFYWRVRAKNISGTGVYSDTWTFSTIDASIFDYSMKAKWNLISVPIDVFDSRKIALFPSAVSDAYAFVSGIGYVSRDTLLQGVGYWVKFADSSIVSFIGASRSFDSISIVSGWNIIGSISAPVAVSDLVEVPSGMIASQFYQYDGSYSPADSVRPSRAYWVKANSGGVLVLASAMQPRIAANSHRELSMLTFEDASGKQQGFLLDLGGLQRDVIAPYAMPSSGEPGNDIVRISEKNSAVDSITRRLSLEILETKGPITLRWSVPGESCCLSLVIDGRLMPIRQSGFIKLTPNTYSIELLFHKKDSE